MPATGALIGYARIHEGHGAAANRSLRGRTIGFQDLRNDADRIREFIDTRDDREKRTFCKRTMTDLTASRTTGALRLTDAVGREIVLMGCISSR